MTNHDPSSIQYQILSDGAKPAMSGLSGGYGLMFSTSGCETDPAAHVEFTGAATDGTPLYFYVEGLPSDGVSYEC